MSRFQWHPKNLLLKRRMQLVQQHVDDQDLDLMFSDARRYPLLDADQERAIDGKKWSAVEALRALFAESAPLAAYTSQFFNETLSNPPEIKRFANREQHFVLRRELVDYLADGKHAAEARRCADKLGQLKRQSSRINLLAELQMPASLTVGMAVSMLRRSGGQAADSVADAIAGWERQWKPPLSGFMLEPEESKTLRRQIRLYTEARDQLVMHNLRLVYSIAARYKGRGIPYPDLIQEGTLGLIRAAEKYEASKGFRFSTYCFNWITQAVRRYVGDVGAMVRFPTHVQEQLGTVLRERAALIAKHGIEPDEETLAEKTGLPASRVSELLQLSNFHISLDAPRFEDEGETLVDALEDHDEGATEDRAEQESLNRFLASALDKLENNERRVLVSRWGLHDGPALSRAEIADVMGISREWVRQLERTALQKLEKEPAIQAVYADYLDDASGY